MSHFAYISSTQALTRSAAQHEEAADACMEAAVAEEANSEMASEIERPVSRKRTSPASPPPPPAPPILSFEDVPASSTPFPTYSRARGNRDKAAGAASVVGKSDAGGQERDKELAVERVPADLSLGKVCLCVCV